MDRLLLTDHYIFDMLVRAGIPLERARSFIPGYGTHPDFEGERLNITVTIGESPNDMPNGIYPISREDADRICQVVLNDMANAYLQHYASEYYDSRTIKSVSENTYLQVLDNIVSVGAIEHIVFGEGRKRYLKEFAFIPSGSSYKILNVFTGYWHIQADSTIKTVWDEYNASLFNLGKYGTRDTIQSVASGLYLAYRRSVGRLEVFASTADADNDLFILTAV